MDDIRLKALVALLKVSDEIIIPFFEFGPDHPVIGDKVNVNRYFDYNFTYKIDKVPYGCILTKDEILSTNWICTKIHYNDHHITESFQALLCHRLGDGFSHRENNAIYFHNIKI